MRYYELYEGPVDDKLIIQVNNVIKTIDDIPDHIKPYILIRNERGRGNKNKYPGIRFVAAYAKRIARKKAKIINLSDRKKLFGF